MSISQNFPDISPSLNLNFAGARKLDSRITFTRGSTGTYVDDNGLVRIAGINQPRFDHSYDGSDITSLGLLIEESRTNLLKYSNAFSTGGAGNWGVVSAACVFTQNITGPDGVSNSAWTIDDQSTAADGAGLDQGVSITPSSSTNYCLSIFAKQGTATYFDFYAFFTGNSVKGSYLRYNFSTDTISVFSSDGGGITPTIYGKIKYPNGWIRLYFVVNDSNNGLNSALSYRIYPGSRDTGVIGTTLFYGAQLEIGSFPTSYIPTTSASVTRSADNASITGTNFSSWYNSTEGTLFAAARVNALGGGTFPGITYVDDGTVNNCIGFYINDFGNDVIGAEAYVSGSNQYGITTFPTPITPNQLTKVITAYKANDFAASFSIANTVGTDNSGSVPTVNRLIIGDLRGNSAKLNGTISQLFYYPKRLTNTQIQNLTK